MKNIYGILEITYFNITDFYYLFVFIDIIIDIVKKNKSCKKLTACEKKDCCSNCPTTIPRPLHIQRGIIAFWAPLPKRPCFN